MIVAQPSGGVMKIVEKVFVGFFLVILMGMIGCQNKGIDLNAQASKSSLTVSGCYQKVSNDCEDDDSSITITQEGSNLAFVGGFDYQRGSYSGTLDGSTTLFNQGSQVNCSGTFSGDVFAGTCDVTVPGQEEVCDFEYHRIS